MLRKLLAVLILLVVGVYFLVSSEGDSAAILDWLRDPAGSSRLHGAAVERDRLRETLLPVAGPELELGPLNFGEPEPSEVEHCLVITQVDEHEPTPDGDPDGLERVVGQVEAVGLADSTRLRQRPVVPVEPGVIRTTDERTRTLVVTQWRGTMAAHVQEPAQDIVAITHQQDPDPGHHPGRL